MIDPAVARCATCGTSYTVRSWYWLEPLDRAGDRRACAVPGCGFPVERASTTALRLATEGRDAANDPPTMIDSPKRSESPMKPKKTTAKKPAPEAPAIISIRGVRPEDHAAFVRAQARISAQAGGAFVSLSQAVLVLARRQAAREDAEEAARAAAQRTPARDELVRRVIDARRAVEETTREGWAGSVADRAALVAAEEEALAALAQDAGLPA